MHWKDWLSQSKSLPARVFDVRKKLCRGQQSTHRRGPRDKMLWGRWVDGSSSVTGALMLHPNAARALLIERDGAKDAVNREAQITSVLVLARILLRRTQRQLL